MNRETVTAALFERLKTIEGILTFGRKPRAWEDVAAAECPALFLGVGSSNTVTPVGQYPLWQIEYLVYLYVHEGGSIGPSEQLNRYCDAIADAVNRDPALDPAGMGTGVATTLGGLVHSVEVPSIQTDEGSFGDRAVALVTLSVLAAG
ncbi:MAG: hypothetical protein WCS72_12190 [Deltaproteobacteria bacterium]